MYYPKQIPYLLDKNFQAHVEYEEYHVEELEEYSMCIWKMKSKNRLKETIHNIILPDACIDLIVNFANQTIYFAGFSKKTEVLELKGDVDYLGVRLKPSAIYSLFSIHADEIMDKHILFSEIEKEHTIEKILLTDNLEEQIEILKQYLIEKSKKGIETKFIDFVDELYNSPKNQTVVNISRDWGYDKRQLFRIFKMQYGVSPKVLLNILRLHFCLILLLEEKRELYEIAYLCGFYDQSHFIKELKKYTGISPVQLLESYQK